jgi:RNase P subunit RPR2
MKIMRFECKQCGEVTPHAEDMVMDKESATVWHCLFCGCEHRPEEPGTPNEPVLAS